MLRIGEAGWIEKPVPECGPMDAICRPLAVAICTSDVHTLWEGAIGDRHNMILGHECSAEVVKVGELVKDFKPGDRVNVERSMRSDGRLDGHIVQGHVDTTAECIGLEDVGGSTYYTFRYSVPDEMAARGYTTVEKGSVCINGVSLTVVDSERDTFKVAIIPYTKEITNFGDLSEGKRVNLEFDISIRHQQVLCIGVNRDELDPAQI